MGRCVRQGEGVGIGEGFPVECFGVVRSLVLDGDRTNDVLLMVVRHNVNLCLCVVFFLLLLKLAVFKYKSTYQSQKD